MYVEGRTHRKIVQVEEARKIKEKFPGLSITKIAKLVELSPETLYTCQWYQTIKPVRGYKAGPSRTAELSSVAKNARPQPSIAQYAAPPTLAEEDFTTQVVQVLNQVATSQRDILALLTRLV
jgi:hypothetical protein|tara:strand:- start:1474 stop:1839 length:366 start_codon:yes stop_codon:yes gene_type:complete